MKHAFISSVILLLALYGQASAAQDWYVFNAHTIQHQQVAHSVQPTWIIANSGDGVRWISYLELQKTKDLVLGQERRYEVMGVGVLQQWAPGLFSQWALEQGLAEHSSLTPKWQMVFQF